MNRPRLAAATLLLALTSCTTAGTPTPAPTTSADAVAHPVAYVIFGTATRLTYNGQSGNRITKTKATTGIDTIYRATLLDGDTARIEVHGVDSTTGLGCSISVDNEQVARESSSNAQAGVTCTYTVR